jgi:6-phosphogluconolactonase
MNYWKGMADDGSPRDRRRMRKDIEIYETKELLTAAAARRIAGLAAKATAARGRFNWALSGGSTPRRLYELLATAPYLRGIDWSRVHFFWSDERCVPPEHAASNYRMAREALLDAVKPPSANVHRMFGEAGPNRAAEEYEQVLRRSFNAIWKGRAPSFDLILLGMGKDGHTALLFPGALPLAEEARWVVPAHADNGAPWRITLTPLIINAAAGIIFLVSGAKKAERVGDVLDGGPAASPAQLIRPKHGRLVWMIDAKAAARLKSP